MPCCEISDCAQMSKTIIAVRHFGLGGRESLETAVIVKSLQILQDQLLSSTSSVYNVNELPSSDIVEAVSLAK